MTIVMTCVTVVAATCNIMLYPNLKSLINKIKNKMREKQKQKLLSLNLTKLFKEIKVEKVKFKLVRDFLAELKREFRDDDDELAKVKSSKIEVSSVEE